jgi:hypothetical protein
LGSDGPESFVLVSKAMARCEFGDGQINWIVGQHEFRLRGLALRTNGGPAVRQGSVTFFGATRVPVSTAALQHLFRPRVRSGSRLCENSGVQLACRTSISISSMWESIVLTTSFGRRQLRKQFCASFAQARFHTAWVKNGSVWARAASRFYPQEQISSACPGMSAWCPYSRAAQACRGAKRSGLSRASPIKARRRQADRPMCWASKSAVPLPIEDVDSFATSRQAKESPVRGADFERGKFAGGRGPSTHSAHAQRRAEDTTTGYH